uniref:Uncharacterized protein n=1 Tax=Lepeophtheirus salmonis TaxID=72036 RepID=A0A0K2TT10_LEPSM
MRHEVPTLTFLINECATINNNGKKTHILRDFILICECLWILFHVTVVAHVA